MKTVFCTLLLSADGRTAVVKRSVPDDLLVLCCYMTLLYVI